MPSVSLGNVTAAGTYIPVYVASAMGFFKQHGVNVKYTEATTPVQDKALISGKLDFGTISSGEVLDANAAGGGFVMIASMANVPASSLFVQKSLKSVADLKGKKIGVGSVGSASYVAAQIVLDKYGMGGQVTLQPIAGGSPPILAALQHGLVEGGQFGPPASGTAAKNGYIELVNGPSVGVKWVQGGVVTTQKFAKAHPDVVKKVAAGLTEAWQFMANPADKTKAIDLIAKGTGSKPAASTATYEYLVKIWASQKVPTVDSAGMRTAVKYSTGKDKTLNPADQFDNSYLPAGG